MSDSLIYDMSMGDDKVEHPFVKKEFLYINDNRCQNIDNYENFQNNNNNNIHDKYYKCSGRYRKVSI